MVCIPLASYLRSLHGLKCDVVETDLSGDPDSEWHEHVWIRLADGRALDPTFDQFPGNESAPVYLGEPSGRIHAKPRSLARIDGENCPVEFLSGRQVY